MSETSHWFEVELERQEGGAVRVRGRGSHHAESEWHTVPAGPLESFAEWLKQAAERDVVVDEKKLEAVELYESLFQGEVSRVWEQLKGMVGSGSVLLGWSVKGGLREVPLEALCEPGQGGGYLGLSNRVLPVRSVSVDRAWQPWEVEGAVRVLGLAPLHEEHLTRLKLALGESVQKGEVEWMEPAVTGERAKRAHLLDRLTTAKGDAHVLCFVGHMGLVRGEPCLRLTDEEGDESWMQVEDLATALEGRFARNLRLVVLHACEGAKPGEVASAAEVLMARGASAVVAHLWKVRSDVAGLYTSAFLRALTQGGQKRGDVVASLNHARRVVWNRHAPNHGAESFSAVLYLRGRQTSLFDFEVRRLKPPAARPAVVEDAQATGVLGALVKKPFSLVLGDASRGERSLHARLEGKLRERLPPEMGGTMQRPPEVPGGELPTSALAQRYVLYRSREQLDQVFQETYRDEVRVLRELLEEGGPKAGRPVEELLGLVRGVVRHVASGVHVTLLRLPLLELALARYRPELTLYVVHPPRRAGDTPSVTVHRPGGAWESLDAVPVSLDVEREVLVLRLYRGYQPGGDIVAPLLSEDDYLLWSPELREVLGEVAERCLEQLWGRPALLVGLSLLTWQHRKLLHGLFGGRALPRGSVTLLEPGGLEGRLWKHGRGLPDEKGVAVVEKGLEELTTLLGSGTQGEVS